MDRRVFIGTLAGGLLTAPLAVEAQRAEQHTPRIGYLGSADANIVGKELEEFRQGLRDAGWIEGRSIAIEYRWAKGKLARIPMLVDELVRLKSDVIVVSGIPSVQAAQRATKTIPVVMAAVFVDPVRAGFVASFAHPGGNITGLASEYEDIVTKQVQLLTEVIPGLSRLVLLRHEDSSGATESRTAHAVGAAGKLGVKAQILEVGEIDEFERVFRVARDGDAQAALVLPSPFFNANRHPLVKYAAQYRLPALYEFGQYTQDGGLMSYGVDLPAMFRRSASYVDRILKGAKPADLPVEQPTKFELVINLKTARALGLTIPPSLLQRADQVIE
jgi:putative ABC transport system substrate-binding protein